jgi:hypothetical protein
MDAIRSYIENIFTNLPKTETVLRAKDEMLANMEEKYHEFKRQGKSENEAVGKVISEFGNIDELLRELHISSSATSQTTKSVRSVDRDEAEGFIQSRKRSGLLNGVGVFLIFLGVAILIGITTSFYGLEFLPFEIRGDLNPVLGIVTLLVLVVVAVGLFIYSAISLEKYEYLKWEFELNGKAKKSIDEMRHKFMIYYPFTLIFAVALCILAPLIIILPAVLYGASESIGLFVALMLAMIAVAVFIFIYVGSIKEAFDKLLKYGDFREEHGGKVVSAISSIVWPFAVIVFLLNGFLGNRWSSAWIIFPITGLAFAIFNGVYKSIKGFKD